MPYIREQGESDEHYEMRVREIDAIKSGSFVVGDTVTVDTRRTDPAEWVTAITTVVARQPQDFEARAEHARYAGTLDY